MNEKLLFNTAIFFTVVGLFLFLITMSSLFITEFKNIPLCKEECKQLNLQYYKVELIYDFRYAYNCICIKDGSPYNIGEIKND